MRIFCLCSMCIHLVSSSVCFFLWNRKRFLEYAIILSSLQPCFCISVIVHDATLRAVNFHRTMGSVTMLLVSWNTSCKMNDESLNTKNFPNYRVYVTVFISLPAWGSSFGFSCYEVALCTNHRGNILWAVLATRQTSVDSRVRTVQRTATLVKNSLR